jgi:hypothetical protein
MSNNRICCGIRRAVRCRYLSYGEYNVTACGAVVVARIDHHDDVTDHFDTCVVMRRRSNVVSLISMTVSRYLSTVPR